MAVLAGDFALFQGQQSRVKSIGSPVASQQRVQEQALEPQDRLEECGEPEKEQRQTVEIQRISSILIMNTIRANIILIFLTINKELQYSCIG